MTTFTIDTENNITAFAHPHEADAVIGSGQTFTNPEELAGLAAGWPTERLVDVWNSFAGVARFGADLKPVKKFENRKAAVARIWKAIQRLNGFATAEAATAVETAPAAPKGAKGAPAKGKASKKTSPAKKSPNGPKAPKPAKPESGALREGSKTAQVVAMLQRKNGATITEIMKAMGWQRHTVRGFVAGAMRKAGHEVESFKPEGGERTYRINTK
jgi:hypothetical protein